MASTPSAFELSSTYLAALSEALGQTTAQANALPASSDLSFERTLSRALARKLDAHSERVLALVQNLLSWSTQGIDPKASPSQTRLDADLLHDGLYTNVVDRLEPLLEAADDELEIHLGVSKNHTSKHAPLRSNVPGIKSKSVPGPSKDRLAPHLLHDPNTVKPQLAFPERLCLPRPGLDDQVLPLEEPIWKPLLRRKVHSLSNSNENADDRASWLRVVHTRHTDRFSSITGTEPPSYPICLHPYQAEIEQLSPPAHYAIRPNLPATPNEHSFDITPFAWVDDEQTFEAMLSHIREMGEQGKKELAIDLEHHDQRTWGGITCLIQLSTRTQDYVIDALDPIVRDLLERLNEFTTDPDWIKVFHGAASDIIWLQRDFGIYIVGLFDTYHATRVLDYPHHSLASLLEKYTDFVPDKRYQLADWRIRPLPEAMLHYARSDTHYLLDVYDHLRIALHELETQSDRTPEGEGKMLVDGDELQVSPLVRVFNLSKTVSSSTFSILPYDSQTGHFENGWLGLLAKNGQLQNYASALRVPTLPIRSGWGPGQIHFELMKVLHRWREAVAREEDESTSWVLSNWALFNLAEQAPREGGELMRIVGGSMGRNGGGVGEVMRRRKGEVVECILRVLREVESRGEKKEGEVVVVSEALKERGEAASEPVVRPVVESLWSDAVEQVAEVKVVAKSSFFGASNKASTSTSSTQNLVASKSGFFGSSSSKKIPAPTVRISADLTPQRAAAIARIHSSLLLGGGLASVSGPRRPLGDGLDSDRALTSLLLCSQSLQGAKVPEPQAPTPVDTSVDTNDSETHASALTGDHSFIPFGERTTKDAPTPSTSKPEPAPKRSDKDVIVVSSLADKPKKKKRALPSPSNEGDLTPSTAPSTSTMTSSSGRPNKPSPSKKPKRSMLEVEPHDYSTSKSILDADPASVASLTQGKKGKKKAKETVGRAAKGFVVDTSEFRKEPRVNKAPKKGNVSRSFAQ
ncbi:BZ3500_MvSof-1268-A1-R1_Chr6-3g08938 [Microbotryum saponariae]|uniref:BZ3500_MvSof-1268-A1-R1_Chr6-3g08938 protein n=1 Tax=Microbotryum saponariae TaxID=289078 RepID=A0A2X0LPW7_9BASI|nr:BZ3500_MvSof-1268-A1-R1_Chr6-3g08938 [Microbotryum saponariae]SDA07540.1 BZ3501_MvSof-1269-A2-R1_Chr6-2g08642 [Microbotryum saponariae]